MLLTPPMTQHDRRDIFAANRGIHARGGCAANGSRRRTETARCRTAPRAASTFVLRQMRLPAEYVDAERNDTRPSTSGWPISKPPRRPLLLSRFANEILVHHQRHAGCMAGLDHRASSSVGANGLTDRGDPRRSSQFHGGGDDSRRSWRRPRTRGAPLAASRARSGTNSCSMRTRGRSQGRVSLRTSQNAESDPLRLRCRATHADGFARRTRSRSMRREACADFRAGVAHSMRRSLTLPSRPASEMQQPRALGAESDRRQTVVPMITTRPQ